MPKTSYASIVDDKRTGGVEEIFSEFGKSRGMDEYYNKYYSAYYSRHVDREQTVHRLHSTARRIE